MSKKLKSLFLLITVFVTLGLFSISPKPAQAQFIVADVWARVRDTIKDFKDNFTSILKEHSALMWKQAQLYFGTKLAKDAAISIASGNPGQMMMFVTDPKEYWGDLADATAGEYLDSLSENVFGKSLCQPTDINVQIEREIGIRSALNSLKGQLTNAIPNMCEEMCQHLAPAEFTGGSRCDINSGPKEGKLCATDNECRPGKCVSDFSETASSGAGASASVKSAVGLTPSLTAQIDQYNSSAKKLMTQVLDIEKNITKGVGENIWENVRRDIYPFLETLEAVPGGDCEGNPDLKSCCNISSSACIYNKYYDRYCNDIDSQWNQDNGILTLEKYYQAIENGNGEFFTTMLRNLFKIESSSEKSKIQAFCGAFNDPIIPDFITKILIPNAWTTNDQKMALGILYLRYTASVPRPKGHLFHLFNTFKTNEFLIKSKALTAQYVNIFSLLDNILPGSQSKTKPIFSYLKYEIDKLEELMGKPREDIIAYLFESNYQPQFNNLNLHNIILNQIRSNSSIFTLVQDLYDLESEIGELDEGFFEAMDNYNTCVMTCEKGEVKVPKNICLATDIYEQASGGRGLEKVGISGVNIGLTLDNVKVGDYGNYCEGGSRNWYPCSSDTDCQPEQGGNCKLRYVKSEDIRKIQQIASDITNNTAGLGQTASGGVDVNVWRNMAEFSSYFEPGNNPIGQLLTAVQESQEKSAGAKAQEEIERQSSGLLPQKSTVSGRRQLPPEAGMSRLERNLASLREANNQYTGSVLAQMWGVFANTLIQKLEEKLYSKGLNPQTFGGPFVGDPRGSLGTGRAVAEAQFADFANPEITVSSNPIQVLAVLTNGCEKNPDKRAYNECIIGSQFQEAISQKLSLSEAIKKRLLFENAIFGYKTKDSEPDIKSDKSAIPYSSMLVLRKYRIIPSSWELAAKYGLYELEQGKRTTTLTLGEAMNGFATPSSPYYQLVDPNWVLKVPQFQCAKEGAGEVILSETPEVFQPAEDVIPKTVVARSSSCGDEQSCIRESADGQQCEKYGYCIREKNTWRFGSGSCDPMFNTCRTYQGPLAPGRENPEVNYLDSTLEQTACVQPEAKGCQEYRRDYRAVAPIFNFQFSIFNNFTYSPRQFKDKFGVNGVFDDTYDFFNDPVEEFIDNKEKPEEKIKADYQTWTPDPSAYLDNSTPNPDGFLTKVPTLWQCKILTSNQSCYFERIAGQEEGCEIPDTASPLRCSPWLKTSEGKLQRNINNDGKPNVSIERVLGENRYWCGLPGGAGCFVSDVQNIQTNDNGQPKLDDQDAIQFVTDQNKDHTTTIARKTCAVVGNKIDPADANNSIVIPVLDSVGQYLTCALGDPIQSRAVLNTPVAQKDTGLPVCDENSAGCQEFARINFNADVYLSDQNQLAMLGKLMDKGKTLAVQGDSKSYQDIFVDKQFTQLGDNLPISENEFTVEPIYLNNKRVMCLAEDMACREIRDSDFTFAAKLNPRRDMCPFDCAGYNSFLALPTALESQLTPEKTGVLNYFVPNKEEGRICDAANEGCEVFSESSGADITTTALHYFNKVAMCVIQDETDPLKSIGGADIETFRTIDGTEGFEPKSWRLMKSDQAAGLNVPIKDSYGNKIKYDDAINDVTNVINNDPFIDKEDVTGNLVKIFETYNGPCIKFTISDNPDNLACADASDSQILSNALSSCLQFNTKEETPENPENPDRRIAVVEFKDSDPNCREFLYFNNEGEAESYPLPLDKIIRAVDNSDTTLTEADKCKPYIRERTRQAYNVINNESAQCPNSTKVGCRRYQGFELAVEGEVFKDDFSDGFAGAWQPKEGDVNSQLEITQGINVGDQALMFSSEIVRTIDKFQSYDEKAREALKDKKYTLSFWTKSTDNQSKIETVKLCSDAKCAVDSVALNSSDITVNKEQIITLGSEAVNFAPLYLSIKQSGDFLLIDRIILKQQTDLFLIEPKVEKGETWAVPPKCDLNSGRICKVDSKYVQDQSSAVAGELCYGPNYAVNNDYTDPANVKTNLDFCKIPAIGKGYCELPFTVKNNDDVYVLKTPEQFLNYIGCENYQVNGADTALTVKNFGELCALEKVGCAPLINTFNTAGALSAVYNKDSGDILSYDKISPPKIFTPEDTIEFWVFDADAQCSLKQKSCAYLAKPVVGIDYQVSGLEPVMVKDDPAYYEQSRESPSNLCYLAQNQCRAYDSGAGEAVFKDPGNKICEYRKGSEAQTSEWYQVSSVSMSALAGDDQDKKYRTAHSGDTLCSLQDFTDKDSNIKVSRPKGVCVDGYGAAILNPNDSSSVYQCDYWVENRPDLPKEEIQRSKSCAEIMKEDLGDQFKNLIVDGDMEDTAPFVDKWTLTSAGWYKDKNIYHSGKQSLYINNTEAGMGESYLSNDSTKNPIYASADTYLLEIWSKASKDNKYQVAVKNLTDGKLLFSSNKFGKKDIWTIYRSVFYVDRNDSKLEIRITIDLKEAKGIEYFDDIKLSKYADCAPVSALCPKEQSMCAEIRDPKASSIEKSFFIINDPNKVNAGDCVSVDDEAGCKLFADMSLKNQTYLTDFNMRADKTEKGTAGNTECNSPSCYNIYGDESSKLKEPLESFCQEFLADGQTNRPMCDSNKIIKVERDRTCGEWLECASSIQLSSGKKKAGDSGSEPLCLARKPCDQWGTDDTCAHFAEDAVNVFSTTQILEEEYKSPKFTKLSEQFYGGTFNKELQSRIKTVSGFSKIGMDFLTGQCLKGSTFAGKLCASGINCFNDSQDEAEIAAICKKEGEKFICQPGTPNAGADCTFETSCVPQDPTCPKPEVDKCQVCPSDNKRDTVSGFNAFSASSKIDGNWYSLDNYDSKSLKTTYPTIQELGDISLVKNGGFEEIDGAEEDLIVLDQKTNQTKNQKVLKPRYWLPGCEGSYSLECSKESPASAMTIISRYERGKSQPHRVKDDNGRFLVKEGNISLMLGSNQGVKQRIDGVRSPGKYVLSAWVKNETASQAGLSVTQYDSEDSTSAINGSVHSTTCFKFTGNYSEFESKNDSYDNCLFVDKPTDGWQFVSKLINIETVSVDKIAQATVYITVELFNNSDGNIYFDEVQLRPHLKIEGEYKDQDGARYSNVKFTGPACRLYAAQDALSCDARDERGSYRRGWRGYCLEWKGDQCLNWWPVDMITGEANAIGAIENAGYAGPAPLYYCAESRDKNLPPKIKMPRLVCVAKNSPTDLVYEGCKIVALVSDPKPEFYDLKEGDWKLGVDANKFGTEDNSDSPGYAVRYVKKGAYNLGNNFAGGLCLWMDNGDGKVEFKEFAGDDKAPNCLNACFAAQGLGGWEANKGAKVFRESENGGQSYGGCEWSKTGSSWRSCGEKLEQAYHKVAYFIFANKDGNIEEGGDDRMGCSSTDNGDRIYTMVIGDFQYQAFCAEPFCFDNDLNFMKYTNPPAILPGFTPADYRNMYDYYRTFDNFGSVYLLTSNFSLTSNLIDNDPDLEGSLRGYIDTPRLQGGSYFYHKEPGGFWGGLLKVLSGDWFGIKSKLIDKLAGMIKWSRFQSVYKDIEDFLANKQEFPFVPLPVSRETRPQQCAVLSKVVDESGDNKALAEIVHKAGDNLIAPLLFDFNKQCVLPGAVLDKKVGYGALPYIYSPAEITMTPTNQETFDEQAEVRTPVEFFHVNNPENNKKNEAKMCKETYHAGNAFYACGDVCSVCVGGGPNNHGKICYSDTDCGTGKCGQTDYVCSGGSKDKYNCKPTCNPVKCISQLCVIDNPDPAGDTGLNQSCNTDQDCKPPKCNENYKCVYAAKDKVVEAGNCPNDAGQTGQNKDCPKGLCVEVPNDKDKVLIKNERAFEAPAQGMSRLQNLFAKGYGAYLWTPSNEPGDIEDSKSSGFEIGQYEPITGEWDITQIINTCSKAKTCAETAGCQPAACVPVVDLLGDYDYCSAKGDCSQCDTKQTKKEIEDCFNGCITKSTCEAKETDGSVKCVFKDPLVCTPAKNPYPQVINIAVKQKNDGTVEIKPEDDHTVELSFGLTANQDQLPIKEIYIDWGDGETTTLGGIAWSADVPNSSSPNLRKFLHTYKYNKPGDKLPADPTKTYGDQFTDPRHTGDCQVNKECVCVNDNCSYKPRVKIVDNWGWCNGDGDSDDGAVGVIGYYQGGKVISYPNCYNKQDIGGNVVSNNNAWDYFEGTVKVFPPKE